MKSNICIEDPNLSHAWARAVKPLLGGGPSDRGPVIVSITSFKKGEPEEDGVIRSALDRVLPDQASCGTVASTIFPVSLWNPALPRQALFDRYLMLLPRLKKAADANKHGLYFQRMIADGRPKNGNQLDDVLTSFLSRDGVRRSVLQVAVFNPKTDHVGSGPRGFPCLQHVSFAPLAGGLSVNAFYASQYAIGRAYGNYLGICRLGRFVAHELGVELTRVTVFAGILQRDPKFSVQSLSALTKTIDEQLTPEKP